MDRYDKLFISIAFAIQTILLAYFALRKWNFDLAMQWGWVVYALAAPAVIVSLALLAGHKPWSLWLAGFLYVAWAAFGYAVDIAHPIAWRTPIYLPVFIPYVLLYMACQMFYWFPLANIRKPLWYIYALLFVTSTILNVTSHGW
jgi:hypothetical protein